VFYDGTHYFIELILICLVGMAKEWGRWRYQLMRGIFDPDGPAAGLIRRTRVRGEGGDRKRKRMSSGQRGVFNPNGKSSK